MTINLQLEQLYLDDKSDRQLFDEGKLSEDQLKQNDTCRLETFNTIAPPSSVRSSFIFYHQKATKTCSKD